MAAVPATQASKTEAAVLPATSTVASSNRLAPLVTTAAASSSSPAAPADRFITTRCTGPQLQSLFDAQLPLKAAFDEKDPILDDPTAAFNRAKVSIQERAEARLPTFYGHTEDTVRLRAAVDALKEIAGPVKTKLAQMVASYWAEKNVEKRVTIKIALQQEFEAAKRSYAAMTGVIKELWPKVKAYGISIKQELAAKQVPPATVKGRATVKDVQMAAKLQKVCSDYDKRKGELEGLLGELEAIGQAIGLYILLSAMLLSWVAGSLVAEAAIEIPEMLEAKAEGLWA